MNTGNDRLAGSSWSRPSTVAGFATGSPNQTLIDFARDERVRAAGRRVLDIGCGAGRNAVPLAANGWDVLGVDLSMPMLVAAAERAREEHVENRCRVVRASMAQLPIASRSCDLVIAHGIWNLAGSAAEFRAAVREAARVARPGAALFVFTFARSTLADGAQPVAGEPFVFVGLTGDRHVFLTQGQLVAELAAGGFVPDPAMPLREVNPRVPGRLIATGSPVIWEGAFRFVATP